MGPTWVLSAPDGPHVGPMNLGIRGLLKSKYKCRSPSLCLYSNVSMQCLFQCSLTYYRPCQVLFLTDIQIVLNCCTHLWHGTDLREVTGSWRQSLCDSSKAYNVYDFVLLIFDIWCFHVIHLLNSSELLHWHRGHRFMVLVQPRN